MTNTAILAFSALLVLAYLLDRLELHLGWVDPLVPIIGTLGLILIVLEGAPVAEAPAEKAAGEAA